MVVEVVVVAATKYQMSHVSAVCFKYSLYHHSFRNTGIIFDTVQCDTTKSLPSHIFRFVHSALLCIMSTCIWQYTSVLRYHHSGQIKYNAVLLHFNYVDYFSSTDHVQLCYCDIKSIYLEIRRSERMQKLMNKQDVTS